MKKNIETIQIKIDKFTLLLKDIDLELKFFTKLLNETEMAILNYSKPCGQKYLLEKNLDAAKIKYKNDESLSNLAELDQILNKLKEIELEIKCYNNRKKILYNRVRYLQKYKKILEDRLLRLKLKLNRASIQWGEQ